MKVIQNPQAMQRLSQRWHLEGKTIGFVPTMGYLHDGHAALLRRARQENQIIVLSIFVNPKQFGPSEDFANYPRDFKKDEMLAKKENVDIIFHPSVDQMYPEGNLSEVEVVRISNVLCGRSRPGHFKGVATVVAKLINIVLPNRLYLGQKDAQQIVVLNQMIKDLNFPVKVSVVPTVREKDGLALSSRNKYLTPQQRHEAPVLFQSLQLAKTKILSGEKNSQTIVALIQKMVSFHSSGRIDYIACVEARTLLPLKKISGRVLIALAVWFGRARLIDNIILNV